MAQATVIMNFAAANHHFYAFRDYWRRRYFTTPRNALCRKAIAIEYDLLAQCRYMLGIYVFHGSFRRRLD